MPARLPRRSLLDEEPSLSLLDAALGDAAQLTDLLTQDDGHAWIRAALDTAPETDPTRRTIWRRLVRHPLLATTANEMDDSVLWTWLQPEEDATRPADRPREEVEALAEGALLDARPGPTGVPPAWVLAEIESAQPRLLAGLGPAARARDVNDRTLADTAAAHYDERLEEVIAALAQPGRRPTWAVAWQQEAARCQIWRDCWRAVTRPDPARWVALAHDLGGQIARLPETHWGTDEDAALVRDGVLALLQRAWHAGQPIPADVVRPYLSASDRVVREHAMRLMSPPPAPTARPASGPRRASPRR